MRGLYDFSIILLGLGFSIARFFNAKAKQRALAKNTWKTDISPGPYDLWMHCASLGEFDQGLPVLWAYKSKVPEAKILVTFFSPSGLNHYHKRAHCVDHACLIPLDHRKNVRDFLTHVKPNAVVFVKYEFWLNFIYGISKRKIPLFSVSTLLRKNQFIFKPLGGIFRNGLKRFNHFYVQNLETKALLATIGIEDATVTGDTRYDHVLNQQRHAIAQPSNNSALAKLQAHCIGKTVLILGSSWLVEEEMVHAIHHKIPLDLTVIAPHDISEDHLYEIEAMFGDQCIRLSEIEKITDETVILVDCIGLLHQLYQLANLAYIGGGFTGKLHNILEPAAYGIPVVFGPKHSKFPEADEFIEKGLAYEVNTPQELLDKIHLLLRNHSMLKEKIIGFVHEKSGATTKITQDLSSKLAHSDFPSN
jgi:3-deoxy-D-manno-octulosonic-acid transferase